MSNLINTPITFVGTWLKLLKQSYQTSSTPCYRLLEILQNKEDEYIAHIQIVNKSLTFYIRPEEVLIDDDFVDQFSQRDIRTLTYLGYIGINSPKYKIISQRLIDDNQILFAIKQQGCNDLIIKTASDIMKEKSLIASMCADDALKIGYAVSSNAYK
jgi:hypothetical protein